MFRGTPSQYRIWQQSSMTMMEGPGCKSMNTNAAEGGGPHPPVNSLVPLDMPVLRSSSQDSMLDLPPESSPTVHTHLKNQQDGIRYGARSGAGGLPLLPSPKIPVPPSLLLPAQPPVGSHHRRRSSAVSSTTSTAACPSGGSSPRGASGAASLLGLFNQPSQAAPSSNLSLPSVSLPPPLGAVPSISTQSRTLKRLPSTGNLIASLFSLPAISTSLQAPPPQKDPKEANIANCSPLMSWQPQAAHGASSSSSAYSAGSAKALEKQRNRHRGEQEILAVAWAQW